MQNILPQKKINKKKEKRKKLKILGHLEIQQVLEQV
jgi:hypothetical protein